MSQAAHVSADQFDAEVLKSPAPVLVDFYAPWCGPCQMLLPIVNNLAAVYAGKVKVVKVNVDDEPTLAGAFGIQGVPTLLLFQNGRIVDSIVGYVPAATIRGKLDRLVETAAPVSGRK